MAPQMFVARITRVKDELPACEPNVINLNLLNFFTNNIHNGIKLYELSPYNLKSVEGYIFENIWQGCKIYQQVIAQKEIKIGKVIWEHPSETHIINNVIQPQYWQWRQKLLNNKFAVRYPNGFYGRHNVVCSVWKEDEKVVYYDYITARKKIYCKIYEQLVYKTEAYHQLKQLYQTHSLQICEIDVRPGLLTEEILREELNNPAQCFGHGYVLAACLMGLSHIWN